MADTEEPQYNTLAERIAALNKQKSFNGSQSSKPAEPIRKRPPPPPPPTRIASDPQPQSRPDPAPAPIAVTVNRVVPPPRTPAVPSRPAVSPGAPPLPRRDTQSSLTSQTSDASQGARPGPPPLPSRTPSAQSVTTLAQRKPSFQITSPEGRRGSTSSELSLRSSASASSFAPTLSSVASTDSARANRKLPPAFDQAKLPPLPPTRRELEARAQQEAQAEAAQPKPQLISTRSAPVTQQISASAPRPGLPPRLPSRPSRANLKSTVQDQQAVEPPKPSQPRKLPPPPSQAPRQPPRPVRDNSRNVTTQPPTPQIDDGPPPVPLASRPTFSQIEAASAKLSMQGSQASQGSQGSRIVQCWVCHDWSGPDEVAAQFPKDSLPRHDPIGHLARGLCDPFPSYTDKARAIFTWFHHNIRYDTVSFFNKNVKHMTPEDTIFTGLAVCQGYAETYKAIAVRAGLECEVVGGHGKGFGHTPLKPGERPPPAKPDGHAWNAVRIDGGQWKLLDACWGAGHLDQSNQYCQKFNSSQFSSSNDIFGRKHFPRDSKFQHRTDGRIVTWDEYFIGQGSHETPTVFTNAYADGIADDTIAPREKQIPVHSGEVVRFQFAHKCEHWKPETHGAGKPSLLLLSIHGVDGRKEDMVPVQTDGHWYWVDVNARDLGAPGQSVQVTQVTTIDGKDARGMSHREFFQKKGKVGMSWSGFIKWDLV